MKFYELVLRHEPKNDLNGSDEKECWYEEYRFSAIDDTVAIKESHNLYDTLGSKCLRRRNIFYCKHTIDELCRIVKTEKIPIYSSGIHQFYYFDKDLNQFRIIVRFSNGDAINFAMEQFPLGDIENKIVKRLAERYRR